MSDGAVVPYRSPRVARVVQLGPVGGLRERDPRVVAGLFLLVMALMFRLVGCTVALQAYVLMLLMGVFQMWQNFELGDLQAFVWMAAIAAVMLMIPNDHTGCLSVKEVQTVLHDCVFYKTLAEPVLKTMEEIQIANLNKTTSWVALDNIKSLFK